MSALCVELGEKSYHIHVGEGMLDRAGEIISAACKGRAAAIVTNRRVGDLYADRLSKSLGASGISSHVVTIPPGERYKTLRTVARIYEELLDQRLDRGGIVIGLGGGIAGDIAGFAAASYLRGVDFVQIPTSLLAQVDASIGGKTGVNLSRGKNLVGAFHQPRAVIIDLSTLGTLPRREFLTGLAEIIKHGIIQDKDYFAFLEKNLSAISCLQSEPLEHTIVRSCEIKAEVVRQDERESGLRRILNYGHTVAHAVERLTNYRQYTHGEAVAIGMVAAALAAREIGNADSDLVERISGIIQAAGLPCSLPDGIEAQDIVTAMGFDKKVSHGRLHSVLVNSIGNAFVTEIAPEVWLSALQAQRRHIL